MNCSSCSQPLPDRARFCPFCGHAVDATSTEERRVVSVLFADIVGFTTLSEHLDPERVKRLVDGGFERMIAEIERFGGRVDKLLGDGVLALFGAPVAHEDDPERAVHAALEMHRVLAEFVADMEIDADVRLRAGVNTGEVVVGTVSRTDDYTAMGDVVNVASRLQSMAPPGGIYVGAATAVQLSPAIERRLVADIVVRGRDQSEEVWSIVGRTGRVYGRSSRHDLPFVGRASQRELLSSVMGLVVEGRGAVVSVSGEAGSGKTRLVDEALARFPHPNPAVFAGVCAPYGETNVWAPIANALYRLIDAEPSIDPDELRRIVHDRGLAMYGYDVDDPRLARFVEGAMHLFGHPSALDRVAPVQAREMLMQIVVEGMHRRAEHGPIVYWLDDLQWADPLLLELFARMSRSLVDRRVLLITAHREDATIDWPPAGDHPVLVRLPVEPLSRAESGELLRTVFVDGLPADLGDRLYERSGGNPLFLTQLARVAHDQPGDQELPGSLRALIAARLDALPTSQRLVIDNAAVLGAAGPNGALERFAAAMGQQFDHDDLERLVDDGLLDVEDDWWRFRSDIVREVAYRTLTKSSRAQRHAGTSAVMREYGLAPIDQVAHHAASAAELVAEIGPVDGVPTDIARKALALLTEATRRSIEVGAFSQAIRHATRAIDLGVADDDERRSLHLLRADAYVERREKEPANADAALALASAVEHEDVTDEAVARRILGILAQQDGELETARHELSASVELLSDGGDRHELATSLSDRGFVEVFGGSLEEADRILHEAEALADDLDDRRRLAWIRQHQAWVAFLSGDTALAEERLTASSGVFSDLGDRSGTGWADGLLAYVRFMERRLDDAETLAESVRTEALELGERWAPAMMDALTASIRLWTGRFTEAEELSRRALTAFRDLNDRFGVVQALAPRMRALVALGRNQEAERGLEEAVSLADAFGDLAFPTMAAAGTAAHLGLGERAVALGEVAVERITKMHADGSEARIGLALGHCQIGEPEVALTVLLDVDDHRPYAHAVRALAHGMLGDHACAVDHADAVVADDTATYLDRVLADLAAGATLVATDDAKGAARRLSDATGAAERAGDEVARALTHCATATLLDGVAVDGVEVDGVEHLGPGWRRVIEGLAATVRDLGAESAC